MQREPNKLWRKIGLQKNFLQGTSHSDQSKQSIIHSIQCSPFILKSDFCQQPNLDKSKVEEVIGQVKYFKVIKRGNNKEDKHLLVSKEGSHMNERVQSPISKLQFSDFEQNCTQWEKNVNSRQSHQLDVDRNVEKLLQMGKQVDRQQMIMDYFDENSSQYIESDFQPSFKKSLCMNSVISIELHQAQRYDSQYLHPSKSNPMHILHCLSQKSIQCKLISSREYQYEEAFVDGSNKRASLQSEVLEVLEYGEMFRAQEVDYKRNERQVVIFKSMQRKKLVLVSSKIDDMKQLHKQSRVETMRSLKKMKEQLTGTITKTFHIQELQYQQKITQLNDQITYLYQQNRNLMTKIGQKQQFIKKTSQQVQKMAQTLSSLQGNKLSNNSQSDKQKDEMIERQQNEINQLYEKMEDWEEMQSSNEFLKEKFHELEGEISRVSQSQFGMRRVLQQVKSQLQEREFNLTEVQSQLREKDIIIQTQEQKHHHTQKQLNQVYIRLDQIHFQLNNQYTQQFQKQQQQFCNKLNQQKEKFTQQKYKIKQQVLDATNKQYHAVIEQMVKKINRLDVEKIIKKFKFSKDHYIGRILKSYFCEDQRENTIKEKAPISTSHHQHHHYKLINNNSANKFVIDDSIRLGQHVDSDHQQSPSKNLRKTGFFGQASHANINSNPQPNDIHKRYSKQRSQFNQELAQYKNMYQTLPYEDKKRTNSKSPQDHSQKSYSSFFKEQQPSKSKISPFYPEYRNRQRSNSSGWSPKRQNSEMFPYTQNPRHNDQKLLKLCQTKREYLTSNDGHDISFTNSQNNYFDDPVKQLMNHKFGINIHTLNSPTHSLPFQTSYAETNYFRSQNYSPERKKSNILLQSQTTYKPYNQPKRGDDEVDDIVQKIKQKITQKFKYQREPSPVHGSYFKPTEFKQNTNNSTRILSPLSKNQGNMGISVNKQIGFEKQSKNYSFGHSTQITPHKLVSQMQQRRSRSKSQNRGRIKSPSLDSRFISPINTPRGSVTNFQKLNKQNKQTLTNSFTKAPTLLNYSRKSPSSRPQPNSYQPIISPHKSPKIQTQRDSINYGKY